MRKSCWRRHLELAQVLNLADEVVLQVENLEAGAQPAQQLNAADILLVQGHLLQRAEHAFIMLCPLAYEALCDACEHAAVKL